MINKALSAYLEQHNIHFCVISHQTTYTAAHAAEAAHVPGRKFAKVVIMRLDGELTMMVIPASANIDFKALQAQTQCKRIEMARENEFMRKFDQCEVGAMPPLGELYNMRVFLAHSLTQQDWVTFNAGNHNELIKLKCKDFLQLTQPSMMINC